MRVNYNISQDILDWVVKQTASDVVLPKTLPMIKEWQKGIKTPTYNQIKAVSRDTRIPLGYFSLRPHLRRKLNYSNTEQSKIRNLSNQVEIW